MAGKVSIIGGSGLYQIEGLENPEWVTVETPWASRRIRS